MKKKLFTFGRLEEAKRLSDILAGRTAFMNKETSTSEIISVESPKYEEVNLEKNYL